MVRRTGTWLRMMAVLAVLGMVAATPVTAVVGPEVDPELARQIRDNPTVGYLIFFKDKADLAPAYRMGWEERGQYVYRELTRVAAESQKQVRAFLDDQGVRYQAFWIDNVIVVEQGSYNAFQGLLNFPEIASLRPLQPQILYEPERVDDAARTQAVESNIARVKANQVWSMGFTGTGMVVANIDTGVRYTHQALVSQYRGNLGGGEFRP